jgi:hypothetical protein
MIIYTIRTEVDRDSATGIATRYGMDVPRIESHWGRHFVHPSREALGPAHNPGRSQG